MNKPKVSFILVSYNHWNLTVACIQSLKQMHCQDFEIIVVDNQSQDESLVQLRKHYKNDQQVMIVANGKNEGFTGGNNRGIERSRGEYVFLLNNDTEVAPDMLTNLLTAAEHSPEASVLCPKIKYFQSPDTIQYAGGKSINLWNGVGSFIGSCEKDIGQYDNSYETELVHGAAVMLHRSVIKKAGSLCETFFLFYEELDWSARILRAGLKMRYIGTAVVYHKESMSIGKENALRTYYITRNRLRFIWRNSKMIQKFVFLCYFSTLSLPINLFRYFRQKKWKLFRAYLKGGVDGILYFFETA